MYPFNCANIFVQKVKIVTFIKLVDSVHNIIMYVDFLNRSEAS